MAIGKEAGDGDVGGFGLEGDGSIRTIDRTAADDPIGTSSHVRRCQADHDSSDSGEGNPLLAGSAAVTIDASIGKLGRMHKVENAAAEADGSAMCRKVDDVDHASESESTAVSPPDGGLRAWMIMIGSFTINGVLFSIINTYSLIYPELQKRLTEAGDTEVSSKAGVRNFPRSAKMLMRYLLITLFNRMNDNIIRAFYRIDKIALIVISWRTVNLFATLASR